MITFFLFDYLMKKCMDTLNDWTQHIRRAQLGAR